MRDFNDFSGCFGDFQTMFLDTDLDNYVVRFYYGDEYPEIAGEAYYKKIIGYTEMGNGDVLLHMIDAEGYDTEDELYDSIERQGVGFNLLSNMIGKDGFAIIPIDQLDWEDDEDEFDDDDDDSDCEYNCSNCGECEIAEWTCECGNVNDGLTMTCSKCGAELVEDDE